MGQRKIYDQEGHAYFITFSCYHRRKHLARDEAKSIVISVLASQLSKHGGTCLGFVIMPDHVHAVVWFNKNGKLSSFMKQWKQISSFHIKKYLLSEAKEYVDTFDRREAIWQRHYYCFNIFSERKLIEKIDYMHNNPLRSGLAEIASEYPYSSFGFYESGKNVGCPIGFVGVSWEGSIAMLFSMGGSDV